MRFWALALVSVFLAACTARHDAPLTDAAPSVASAPDVSAESPDWTMAVEGRTVRVQVVTPDSAPPWPTVMLLHGASGLGRGYMIWPVAQALAKRGVAAAVVRYFDALPDEVHRKGAVRYFQRRERLLGEMVDQLLAKPEVMGPEIGVYGYSLGAFHGLAMAAKDRRIAAVAALAGGLPRHVPAKAVERAAPVLLVHGTRDRIVPYSRTKEAEAVWRRFGRPASVLRLQNTGHVPRPVDRQRLASVAADFLAKELLLQVAALR